jgi:hypothetical protein
MQIIADRKQPGFSHIAPALQQLVGDAWPTKHAQTLFIATPRAGIETELVELLLLESLIGEAFTDGAESQLILAHVKAECGVSIADVLSTQRGHGWILRSVGQACHARHTTSGMNEGGAKSATFCTRLYATLHEVAMEQFQLASAAAGSSPESSHAVLTPSTKDTST